jgi:hypothetical protein
MISRELKVDSRLYCFQVGVALMQGTWIACCLSTWYAGASGACEASETRRNRAVRRRVTVPCTMVLRMLVKCRRPDVIALCDSELRCYTKAWNRPTGSGAIVFSLIRWCLSRFCARRSFDGCREWDVRATPNIPMLQLGFIAVWLLSQQRAYKRGALLGGQSVRLTGSMVMRSTCRIRVAPRGG